MYIHSTIDMVNDISKCTLDTKEPTRFVPSRRGPCTVPFRGHYGEWLLHDQCLNTTINLMLVGDSL